MFYLTLLTFIITKSLALQWASNFISGLPPLSGHAAIGNSSGFYIINPYPLGSNSPLTRFYNYQTSSLVTLSSFSALTARSSYSISPNADNTIAVLHGGKAMANGGAIIYFSDLFVLDLITGAWAKSDLLQGSNITRLAHHAMTFDSHQEIFYISGGISDGNTINGNFFKVNVVKPNTFQHSLTVDKDLSPFKVYGHSLVYHRDFITGKSMLILYGGFNAIPLQKPVTNATALNRIYTCSMIPSAKDVSNCEFTTYPSESNVTYRFGHDAIMNPVTNEMIVVGGILDFASAPTNRVSAYYVPEGTGLSRRWTVSPANNISSSVCNSAVFLLKIDPDTTALVRYGGAQTTATCGLTLPVFQDLSSFDQKVDLSLFYFGNAPRGPSFITSTTISSSISTSASNNAKAPPSINNQQIQLETMPLSTLIILLSVLSAVFITTVVYYFVENPQLFRKLRGRKVGG